MKKFFAEFLLIVVGVLTALALESAWQDRTDRVTERELLLAIQTELASNAESLQRWIELNSRVSAATADLVNRLGAAERGQEISVPDSILADVLRTPTYDPDQASLEAALRSGAITLIRSTAIQRTLAQWDRLLADAREEETKGLSIVTQHLMPLLAKDAHLQSSLQFQVLTNRALMRDQPIPPWPDDHSPVNASRELQNLLMIRMRSSEGAVSELQILQECLEEAQALISEEIS